MHEWAVLLGVDEGSAAQEKVVGRGRFAMDVVGGGRIVHSQIQLLPQPLPLQLLRAQVPEPRVVHLHQNHRPVIAIYLPITHTKQHIQLLLHTFIHWQYPNAIWHTIIRVSKLGYSPFRFLEYFTKLWVHPYTNVSVYSWFRWTESHASISYRSLSSLCGDIWAHWALCS